MQDIGHGIYYSQTECIHFMVHYFLMFPLAKTMNSRDVNSLTLSCNIRNCLKYREKRGGVTL